MESDEKFQIWLKPGKNIERFTLRPKYVLLLPTILSGIRLFISPSVCQFVHLSACISVTPNGRICVALHVGDLNKQLSLIPHLLKLRAKSDTGH
jgi:hypothetical protein